MQHHIGASIQEMDKTCGAKKFSVSVEWAPMICLREQWMHHHKSINFSPKADILTEEEFGYFFFWLSNGLFFLWSRVMPDDDRRAVEIPNKNLVAKYSLSMVYYVTGRML